MDLPRGYPGKNDLPPSRRAFTGVFVTGEGGHRKRTKRLGGGNLPRDNLRDGDDPGVLLIGKMKVDLPIP
jgi:hypothetical protein